MRRSSGVRMLGLFVLLAGALASPLAGQQLDDVTTLRRDYGVAQRRYDAAAAVWLQREERWRQANNALALARATGDDSDEDALESRALQASDELQQQDLRVAMVREELDSARVALRAALDRQLGRYSDQFLQAPTQAARDSIGVLIEDLRFQFAELADPDPEEILLTREVLPAITYDPRDRPSDLRNKIELAERQAERYTGLIEELEIEIERRRAFLRTERLQRDSRAGIRRFGDPQLPVTSGGSQSSQSGLAQDSTGIILDDLPPEEAIARLETQKLQLENSRAEMLRRAGIFRDLIRAEDNR